MSSKSHQHHHPKLKPPPRLLFSCAMFRNCTQTVLSPTSTTTNAPPLPSSSSSSGCGADTSSATVPPKSPPPAFSPPTPSPPPMQHTPPRSSPSPKSAVTLQPVETDPPPASSSSSSSSSSASHSFTLWRFPLHHAHSDSHYLHQSAAAALDLPVAANNKNSSNGSRDLEEAFIAADRYFACGSCLPALRLLERSLAVHDPAAAPCPREVMAGVVASVIDQSTARPAAKVLLALLLAENNRRPAVEAGAAAAALNAVANAASGTTGTAAAERALAALELMCTVPEGAAEVRVRPGAATVLAAAAGRLSGRGRECAMGVLAALYGGEWAADAPEEVGRAVVAAMQGECSARGKRKGAQLLKALQDAGRLAGVVDDGC